MDEWNMHTEAYDQLSELIDQMCAPLEQGEYDGIKTVIYFNDDSKAGLRMHGYGDPRDAISDLLYGVREVLGQMGYQMEITGPHSLQGMN